MSLMSPMKDRGVGQFFIEFFHNSVNIINIALAVRYRQKFEDFFLSDENGLPLNRMEQFSVESHKPSLFIQCPQMFCSIFSFNRDLHLGNCIRTAYK